MKIPLRRWYVVQTQPRAERRAATHLARQGFEVYLPCYLKKRRHARRVETMPAPLFPRYLFVSIDIVTQRWRSISSTFGVTRLVCNGEDPAPIADDVIEALRHREDNGFVRLSARSRFSIGDPVRLVGGAFANCFAQFESMTDAERVCVLLDLLGRKVRLVLDADWVAAA